MASHKHNACKTPQKSTAVSQISSPLKFQQNRYRSPLANIQNVSSKVASCQFTSGSPMHIPPHNHGTPPRAFFKVKNPFEKHLIDNLHTPICSPGMFKIRESETGSFKWDIEHVSILKPADIEPCNSQFDPSPDPLLEEKATKAIERFFSQEMIVPSPMDEAPKRNILLPMDSKDEHTTPEGIKSATREVWTQTALTLPIDLPLEIENTLKAFCTFSKQEQIGVGEADISANASLRRKLCFEEIYSDVEEDEVHMSVHNVSCSVLHSPQVNPLLRGFKRNFETPQSKSSKENSKELMITPGSNKRLSEEELIGLSPIVKQEIKSRTSSNDGEDVALHSPSISPIHKSPKETASLAMSPKKCEDAHHSCDASPFSQSTPEKSSLTSKSSIKSSPETSDTSDIPIQHRRNVKNVKYFKFTDDMCNLGRDESRIGTRSKSEMSIISLGRSRSAIKLDFSMDVSSENSMHLCGNQSVTGDSEPNSPGEATGGNYWDLEMAQFVVNSKKSEVATKCGKCDTILTTVDNTYDTIVKENLCDCQSAIDERLKEVYQFVTPTKVKIYEAVVDDNDCHSSTNKTYSSPMQTSPGSCVSTCADVSRKTELFGSHFTMNYSRSLDEYSSSTMTSSSLFKNNFILPDNLKKSHTFSRKDSGFNEHLGVSNVSNIPSQDTTKSFAISTEASNVSWKRFDSGFNEETSSDFSQHVSRSEISKHMSKKYTPILEYSENKENIYFEDYHKMCEYKSSGHEAMSVSDIFPEEVSFTCNFSSTPSQSRFCKSTK